MLSLRGDSRARARGRPTRGRRQAHPRCPTRARVGRLRRATRTTVRRSPPPPHSPSPIRGWTPRGALEEELDELVKTAQQRDEYLALAQRTQADFENYRKRVARDAAQAQDRGMAKLAKELLPALDNLDRAIEAAQDEDPLLAGVRLVRAELAAALARVGIEQFAPLGERFDPAEHEAMAQQPIEGAESGTVAEVYQNGYRLNGTVIRPARVLVAA